MNVKFCFSILLLFVLLLPMAAQPKPPMIDVKEDAPEWMKMMMEDSPNIAKIKEAYELYYKNNEFVKNTYTQYYPYSVFYDSLFTMKVTLSGQMLICML